MQRACQNIQIRFIIILLWHFVFFSRPSACPLDTVTLFNASCCCKKRVFLQLGAELHVCPRPHSDQNCPSFVPMWDRRRAGGGGGAHIYDMFAPVVLEREPNQS